MADWKAGDFDDDGDGWEDVAAVPVVAAAPTPASITATQSGNAGSRPRIGGTASSNARASKVKSIANARKHEKKTLTQAPGHGRVVNSGSLAQSEDKQFENVVPPPLHTGPPAKLHTGLPAKESGSNAASHQNDIGSNKDASIQEAYNAEETVEKLKASLLASERKYAALTRERDGLRHARESRASGVELAKEKDKQIAAIMAEGEMLSVKIAEKETALRNARATLKEQSAEIDNLKLAVNAAEAKIQSLAAKQRALETSEKAAHEGKEAAERRMRQTESDMRTKSSSSAALEAARSQLESLRKTHATALENQSMRLRAEAEAELEKAKAKAEEELTTLNRAIAELRAHLSQVTENAGWKEDQLRKEIEELRARAESLEARNEELAEAVPGATRPLLRQVEALQAAAQERTSAVSAVERSQLERLRQAEGTVAAGAERERAAEERIGGLLTRIAALDEQVKLMQADSARMAAELRDNRSSAAHAELEHRRALDSAQVTSMKFLREKEAAVDELSKARAAYLDDVEAAEERERKLSEKIFNLEAKIETMQSRLANVQAGSQSVLLGSPRLMQYDGELQQSDSMSSMGQPTRPRLASGEDFFSPRPVDDASSSAKWSARTGSFVDNVISPGVFLAESVSAPGGMYDTERLQASLRQRTDEIASLQAQLDGKEKASQALADEVVSMAARVEELTNELNDAPELRKELEDYKVRHRTLLQLHGEREERVLELEADLADINQMYKEQITELLLKLEQLT